MKDTFEGLNPDEFEGYGPEMVSLVNVINQQAGVIEDLEGRIDQNESRVVDSAEDAFYSNLAEAIPDWQTINVDPRWLAWLAQEDEMSGLQRQVLLDEAAGKFDAKRFVTGLKKAEAA